MPERPGSVVARGVAQFQDDAFSRAARPRSFQGLPLQRCLGTLERRLIEREKMTGEFLLAKQRRQPECGAGFIQAQHRLRFVTQPAEAGFNEEPRGQGRMKGALRLRRHERVKFRIPGDTPRLRVIGSDLKPRLVAGDDEPRFDVPLFRRRPADEGADQLRPSREVFGLTPGVESGARRLQISDAVQRCGVGELPLGERRGDIVPEGEDVARRFRPEMERFVALDGPSRMDAHHVVVVQRTALLKAVESCLDLQQILLVTRRWHASEFLLQNLTKRFRRRGLPRFRRCRRLSLQDRGAQGDGGQGLVFQFGLAAPHGACLVQHDMRRVILQRDLGLDPLGCVIQQADRAILHKQPCLRNCLCRVKGKEELDCGGCGHRWWETCAGRGANGEPSTAAAGRATSRGDLRSFWSRVSGRKRA